jgi:hypothetical protein
MNKISQIPRDVETIKKQLDDLAKVKATSDCNLRVDFASSLFLDSMDAHEKELKEELKAAEWLQTKLDLELSLIGSSVKEHTLQANVLGKLLEQVQNIWLAIAEMTTGSKSSLGRFPKDLIKKNILRVKCFVPSSFAIHFLFDKEYAENSLFDTANDKTDEENLFVSLFSQDVEDNELDSFSLSTRLNSYYTDLLTLLAEQNITISTRTKQHPFAVNMTPQAARERKDYIKYALTDLTEEKEENIFIEGILVMGDIQKNIFTIIDETTIYRGQVSVEGADGLKKFTLGSKVGANLLVTRVNEDSARPSYTLLSLEAAS